jgi:hypothetical protein
MSSDRNDNRLTVSWNTKNSLRREQPEKAPRHVTAGIMSPTPAPCLAYAVLGVHGGRGEQA